MTDTIQAFYKIILGLCIGSFLNVLIYRIPKEISIISPRSFCPECKKIITFRENIPLISWILQKGKCSNCKTNINIQYPLIEIFTAILFLVFSYSSPSIYSSYVDLFFENIFSWIFLSLLLVISLIDIKNFWIPQSLINFGFLVGLINLIFISIINENISIHNNLLKGLTSSLICYFVFESLRISAKKIYKRDALGKGDSKLVSMMTIWLGPIGIIFSIGISYIVAAILIVIFFLIKKIKKGQIIPFAPFLSIGGLIVWYFGNESLIRLIYYN